jgi:uncharacterized membrane protein YtjA (UPF0391 family)
MFRLALLLFVSALAAGLCGFGVIADLSLEMGRILFFVFLMLAALTCMMALRDRGSFGDGALGR